ncbi:MAG TPA: hypothetical protein VKE91_14475 [Blastocatellia bacterium]|nr:hypothetical protein [Blastocatellia bacterium]
MADETITADPIEMDDLIAFNGIDATTGDYLIKPINDSEASRIAIGHPQDKNLVNAISNAKRQTEVDHLGGAFDLKLEDVTQAGWAIIFHKDEDQAVKDALAPLIERRREQIGDDNIVKVLEYRDGDQVIPWLARNKIKFGLVEPEKVPYYILIVGSPDRIPFEFGQALDVVYAVGRLHFSAAGQYQRYVESVLEYEKSAKVPNSKEIVFWGPRNKNDKPTKLSSEHLIKPLALGAEGKKSAVERAAKFSKVAYIGKLFDPENSTKGNLLSVFNPGAGESGPCLLFTASHGVGWPKGDPNQLGAQGALLCQDFPGRGLGPLKPEHYFAAADLPKEARVHGLVCFHFACFSAGTPKDDRFSYQPGAPPQALALNPFFSALPQALLSHPNGAALGVIGHVERAWQNSIITEGAGTQLLPFENAIGFIADGQPLGWALKEFNDVFAASSVNLTNVIRDKDGGVDVSDRKIAELWLERNDAEGYVLMGDPAVRLRKDALM